MARFLYSTIYNRHFLVACGIAFILSRLALLLVQVDPASDGAWYYARAVGLAAGEGYTESGHPTAFWPVGYPAFLGGLFFMFGDSVLAAQLANMLFGLLILIAGYRLANDLGAGETTARLVVLMLTVYPNFAAYTAATLTELFFTAIFMWATIFSVRASVLSSALAAGALFGLATLTKAQTILFPAFLTAFLILSRLAYGRLLFRFLSLRTILIKMVLVYVVMLAIVLPWSLRNYYTLGAFVLVSTNGGITLLTGNHPNATGSFSPENNPLMDRLAVPFESRVERQVEYDKQARALAIRWITENPWDFLALVPLKVFWLWAPDGEGEWWYQHGYPLYEEHKTLFRAFRYVNQAYYFGLLFLSAVTVYATLARRRWPPDLLICMVPPIFITWVSVLFSGQSRFHFPAMPFIAILAAMALSTLLESRNNQPLAHA